MAHANQCHHLMFMVRATHHTAFGRFGLSVSKAKSSLSGRPGLGFDRLSQNGVIGQ